MAAKPPVQKLFFPHGQRASPEYHDMTRYCMTRDIATLAKMKKKKNPANMWASVIKFNHLVSLKKLKIRFHCVCLRAERAKSI